MLAFGFLIAIILYLLFSGVIYIYNSINNNFELKLLDACVNNDENQFKSILESKFTLNTKNQCILDLALYNASKNGNVFMVTKLIELGANITADIVTSGIILQDYDNCIDIAYQRYNIEVVKLLLRNIEKKDKAFAFRLACKYNQIDIIKELNESGFDLKYHNSIGLQIAIEESHVTLVKFFVEHGCTIIEKRLESNNEKIKAFLIAKYSR